MKKTISISKNESSLFAEKNNYSIIIHNQQKYKLPEKFTLPITKKTNKLYHDIKKLEHLSAGQKAFQLNQLHHRVTQFKLSPQELVSNVDTNKWIPMLLGDLCYAPLPTGHTIYNCGRPSSIPLTPLQKNRIKTLSDQLTHYYESTHLLNTVSEVAIPRHYRNPDINHINDPIIPEILEELLDTLTQDIEDDHLTDDYSLRQSIQFLLAAKKLNSEGPNYSIGAHSKSKEPEIWIPLLATALVRKECCINPQVELIGTEDWETKLHSFLIKTWALSDTIDLSQHIKTLHPSIQPQQSMAFLQEKSKLPLPNGEWSSTELTIFAGLEICIRTELTRFTIEFTGGAKGRLRDSSGANGQCGSEYSSAGINAILEHKNQPDTPQSLSDWVTRQLYHFRANQLRLVMMPGNQRQNETFFFAETMRTIELLENPNIDLGDMTDRGSEKLSDIVLREITPKKCVDYLQSLIIQNQSDLLKLTTTPEEKTLIVTLTHSKGALYSYLSDLGMLVGDQISKRNDIQTKQIKRLIESLCILSPELYLPAQKNLCTSTHPLYEETTQLLRRQLTDELLNDPILTSESKHFIQTMYPILEKGLTLILQEGTPLEVENGINLLQHCIKENDMRIEVFNTPQLVESMITRFEPLNDTSRRQIFTIIHSLSEPPGNRYGLSETQGLLELINQHHTQYPILLDTLLHIATNSHSHLQFLPIPELFDLIMQALPKSLPIVEELSKNEAYVPCLIPSLHHIFKACHQTTSTSFSTNLDPVSFKKGLSILKEFASYPKTHIDFSIQLQTHLHTLTSFWTDSESPPQLQPSSNLYRNTSKNSIPEQLLILLSEISSEPTYLNALVKTKGIRDGYLSLLKKPEIETTNPEIIQMITLIADDPELRHMLLRHPSGSMAWLLYCTTPDEDIKQETMQSLMSQNSDSETLLDTMHLWPALLNKPIYTQYMACSNFKCHLSRKSRHLISSFKLLSTYDLNRIRHISIDQVSKNSLVLRRKMSQEINTIKSRPLSVEEQRGLAPEGVIAFSLDGHLPISNAALPILNVKNQSIPERDWVDQLLSLDMMVELAKIPSQANALVSTVGLIKLLSDTVHKTRPMWNAIETHYQLHFIVFHDQFNASVKILGELLHVNQGHYKNEILRQCPNSTLLTHLANRRPEAIFSDIDNAEKLLNQSNNHIAHTVETLAWASDQDSTIFIINQLIKRLPTCIRENPNLITNIVPLLKRQDVGVSMAHMLVHTIKTHPVVLPHLKTADMIDSLSSHYTDDTPKDPIVKKAIYTLLKYALGIKSMGQWTSDPTVSPLINDPQIQERIPIILDQPETRTALRNILNTTD